MTRPIGRTRRVLGWAALLALLALAVLPSKTAVQTAVVAQGETTDGEPLVVFPSGAMAVTFCRKGITRTLVASDVLGSSRLAEVLVHEAKHREQAALYAPDCPPYKQRPLLLLDDEIAAYCASAPYRRVGGESATWIVEDYTAVIAQQFLGIVPASTVDSLYAARCP